MAYEKKLVCLANSRKIRGRCVAGKEVLPDGSSAWIRPVSSSPTGEVPDKDRCYQSGADPKLGDIISITFKQASPHGFQQENHLYDDGFYWTREGQVDWADLKLLADTSSRELWENGHSTRVGMNDRVPVNVANTFDHSLLLLELTSVTLRVLAPGAAFGDHTRKVRARFTYRRTEYDLTVTDL